MIDVAVGVCVDVTGADETTTDVEVSSVVEVNRMVLVAWIVVLREVSGVGVNEITVVISSTVEVGPGVDSVRDSVGLTPVVKLICTDVDWVKVVTRTV